MTEQNKRADLLYGARAVADYANVSERQARYLMSSGTLSWFRLNGKVCSTRSAVDTMIAEQQAKAAREARKEAADE